MKKCLLLIAVFLLAAACDHEPDSKVKHGEQLVFKTEDTILRNGDLVGVSMDSPLSYVNVKMTYSSGDLTPANKLYWPAEMRDSAVTFLAYYPYSAEYNEGGAVVFAAAPDQTTDDAFRASALMVSVAQAAHTDPAVNFTFTQKMSKLVFYLRNDSGKPVTDVSFTAYPSLTFNMDKRSFKLTGEKVDIHAHLSATSADGVQAFEAIIAPQAIVGLTLTIKTESAEYTAIAASSINFGSGKQYSNARLLVLEAGHTKPVNFTVNAADWAQSPDFVYLDPLSGAELTTISDPGLYSIVNDVAVPLRSFVPGSDQYSLFTGKSLSGWRMMNPAAGELFEISSPMTYTTEGNSSTVNVKSFGLSGFEADYSSTASTIKAENGLVWLLDDNKSYGYIVMSE
ncbi:MAG: fimbrillin family protein [Bacteroidales bacterium]|nr:fimbrillin family protein [Bacteroidales bacterium]